MKRYIICFLVSILLSQPPGFSQYLSNLHATKDDPLFTTYAAPLSRSSYKTDQGYQFLWNDTETGVQFISRDGLNMGLAFSLGDEFRYRLSDFYMEPVITTSYSDIVTFYYYPFKDIRVDFTFDVWSSQQTIEDIRITNEGAFQAEIGFSPYFYYPSSDTLQNISHGSTFDFYSFALSKKRDSWMIGHSIPVTENLTGIIFGNTRYDSAQTFVLKNQTGNFLKKNTIADLKRSLSLQKRYAKAIKGLIYFRNFRMQPGDMVHFRIIAGLDDSAIRPVDLYRKSKSLMETDLRKVILDDEKAYSRIPAPPLSPPQSGRGNLEMFYWSCFSLLRQCMMPPEGKCSYNYYIFSREPKWGWGYGGQVFHESLAMMAYAYMDPEGAMNSQRVYFERQRPDGYINYRTGPYLDETIENNGAPTTSAPWFNYENLEIYKVTRDKKFLKEAYESGKKFYQYYVTTRDSNSNGLCEWGGDAELESVRDARVSVWDKVGGPSNFEGPDLNSMLVKEGVSLAEIAEILGNTAEAAEWRSEVRGRKELINKKMWDPETGFYYNVNKKNGSFTFRTKDDLKIKEIIGFLPLWAGIADSAKVRQLVKVMTDTTEFWRPYGVPSLSAKDDYYNPIGYWNGPVWVQWDYLLFRGLLDHGYKKETRQLAFKVLDNMVWHLKNDHVFWELYSADDRQAGWNKTYIWAGLAARFLIDLGGK